MPTPPQFTQKVAENYQNYFVPAIGAPVADDLIRAADLQSGERVLDVACGTGVVARRAADLVGARGHVTGLDVSPDMLAVAETATPSAVPIDWRQADAAHMDLPDAGYDAVLCQLSLQFMPHQVDALREMHRVLAPGGRLALNVPGDETPVFSVMAGALERHVGAEAGGFLHHVFSLHDAGVVTDLVRQAGFEDVDVGVHDVDLQVPAPREFLWQYIESTPLAGPVAQAGDRARAAIEEDVVTSLKPLQSNGGLVCRQPIVTVVARKPA